MRLRALALTTTLMTALPLMAGASDLTSLSDAEREAFRAEVREYLLENPEVLMEAIAALEARQAAEQATADADLVAANLADLHDTDRSWVGGNPEGDITLVEFVDYRCGYCRRAHDEVARLIEEDGNIRLILKEFPILGEESLLSSQFAVAVLQTEGPEAYKQVHDALITLRANVTPETLERIASDLALDGPTLLEVAQSDAVRDVLRQNRALAERMQISGTPTFVMNDRMLRGYLPYDGMVQQLAQVRAE